MRKILFCLVTEKVYSTDCREWPFDTGGGGRSEFMVIFGG